MMPEEQHNIELIGERFAPHFEICARFLGALCDPFLEELQAAVVGRAGGTRIAAIGISVREIRRYRSIIAMCQLGFVENAEILARSLFEGLLAERFIFRAHKPLKTCSPELLGIRRNLPPIPAGWTARDFRAALYCCFQTLRIHAIGEKGSKHPGSKRVLSKKRKLRMRGQVDDIEKIVGADWFKVLNRHPKTYSGLSIRNLAENCGQLKTYDIIYGLQSTTSHANDPLKYVHVDEKDKTFCAMVAGVDEAELRRNLQLASAVVATIASDLAVEFKLPSKAAIDEFLPAIAALDP